MDFIPLTGGFEWKHGMSGSLLHLIERADAILGIDFIQLTDGFERKHGKVMFLSARDGEDGRQLN